MSDKYLLLEDMRLYCFNTTCLWKNVWKEYYTDLPTSRGFVKCFNSGSILSNFKKYNNEFYRCIITNTANEKFKVVFNSDFVEMFFTRDFIKI